MLVVLELLAEASNSHITVYHHRQLLYPGDHNHHRPALTVETRPAHRICTIIYSSVCTIQGRGDGPKASTS